MVTFVTKAGARMATTQYSLNSFKMCLFKRVNVSEESEHQVDLY